MPVPRWRIWRALFFPIISMTCLAALAAGPVTVQVTPNPILVGESGQLQLISEDDIPKFTALPKVANLEWLGGPQTSTSIQINNFKRSTRYTATYFFQVLKPGQYVIPAFTVSVDGSQVTTTPPQVVLQASGGTAPATAGQSISMDDAFFAKIIPGIQVDAKTPVYVGQEIPMEIKVYILEQLDRGSSLSYPELQVENAVFRENPVRNRENPKFMVTQDGREIVNNQPFKVISFRCFLTPLAAGLITGKAIIQAQLVLPDRRRQRRANDPFDNGILDPFFQTRQAVTRQAVADFPSLNVSALPPQPAGTGHFLGLVGQWNLNLNSTPATVHVGEPVTLTLEIQGSGNLDALIPPKLEGRQFRAYEPELKKDARNPNQATITWVAVPLTLDATLPELIFSVFHPEDQQYQFYRFKSSVKVLQAVNQEGRSVIADAGSVPPPAGELRNAAKTANDILYVKTRPGPAVKLPLWRNHLLFTLLLAGLGVINFGLLHLLAARREKLSGSLSFRRRQHALRQRGAIFRELQHAAPEQRAALVREKLVPYLSALLDLPPGATADAVAQHLETRDERLAGALRQAQEGEFRPGGMEEINIKELLLGVKKLLTFMLFAGVLFLLNPSLAAAAADPAITPEDTMIKATAAYDRGEVEAARLLYGQLTRPKTENPGLLYNQANCAYRTGHSGEAIALYERARRLAPRDSDIVENLNFIRRQLGMPPVGGTETPRELLVKLRDSLRPDEWLLLAAATVFVLGTGVGIRRWYRLGSGAVWSVGGILLLICLLAAWNQSQTSYRTESQGVVTLDNPVCRRLPDATAEKAPLKLQQGEPVAIMEQRSDWYRVRSGEAEAWIEKNAVHMIW